MNKLINWPKTYQQPGIFHIYLTERKTGKTFSKILEIFQRIISHGEFFAWVRRHWHDSLECSKPLFLDVLWEIEREGLISGFQAKEWEVKEKGVFYQGELYIFFYDLFSYKKARGGRAKTVSEIVYEEAIPIDQEFLAREQFNFRDLVDSLKRKDQPLKITFLANPYSWSSWFLGIFEEEGSLWEAKREAEELLAQKDKKGVKVWSKDGQWFLYINLVKPREDVHSLALEEAKNPSLRNWDEFMIPKPKKYQIICALQDFYFCELGERKVHKKYALMHFTRNQKETAQDLVNFCFDYEEVAKSKLKNCRLRDKGELIRKWVKMLKESMLKFADYRSRDWFLEQIKGVMAPGRRKN
jgi:hypothetical protein